MFITIQACCHIIISWKLNLYNYYSRINVVQFASYKGHCQKNLDVQYSFLHEIFSNCCIVKHKNYLKNQTFFLVSNNANKIYYRAIYVTIYGRKFCCESITDLF